MGEATQPAPVLLILAAFSRHRAALAWARDRACQSWGPLALESAVFRFAETDYYRPTMGPGLEKQFFAFEPLVDPAQIVAAKLSANQWERDYAAVSGHPETRPLNLDPGYLNLGKLVLASTKDHAHRIYLDRGIYAEVTLRYTERAWRPQGWTFADYRRDDYHAFFSACRDYLHRRLREERP